MATQKRNALGRGLDALLSMDDVKTEGSSSINEIELAKITVNPNQPRREFDETALQELADSIAEIGIIQPITLRKLSDDEYQIIASDRYLVGGGLWGSIALIGPTRMPFQKLMPLLHYFADQLGEGMSGKRKDTPQAAVPRRTVIYKEDLE